MSGKKEANALRQIGKEFLQHAPGNALVGGGLGALGTGVKQTIQGEFDGGELLRNTLIGGGAGLGASGGTHLAKALDPVARKNINRVLNLEKAVKAERAAMRNVPPKPNLSGSAMDSVRDLFGQPKAFSQDALHRAMSKRNEHDMGMGGAIAVTGGLLGAAAGGKAVADATDSKFAAVDGIMQKDSFNDGFSKGVEKVAENLAAELNISKEDALAELNDKIAFMGGAYNAAKAFGGNLVGGLKAMGGAMQRGAQGAMKNMGANASRNGVAGVGKTLQGGAQAATKGFQRGIQGMSQAQSQALKNTALAGGAGAVGFGAGRM